MNKISIEGTDIANTFFHFTVNATTDCSHEGTETIITVELKLATADRVLAQFGNIPVGHNP